MSASGLTVRWQRAPASEWFGNRDRIAAHLPAILTGDFNLTDDKG